MKQADCSEAAWQTGKGMGFLLQVVADSGGFRTGLMGPEVYSDCRVEVGLRGRSRGRKMVDRLA